MPLYRYRCGDCGHEFSARQRFSDDPLTECPVCEGEVRRVINSVGVVFKGSGFYVTDNRNGSNGGGSKRSAETKSESTPDATPAPKTEAKSETSGTAAASAPAG